MKNKIRNILEILSIVVPAIVSICSTILDKILQIEIWSVLSIIFTIITLIFASIILVINIRQGKKHQETIASLRETIDVCCDGKRYLSNEATIEFLKDELAYRITICKKFEVLSMYKDYYPLYISCDKYPENIDKSTNFYEQQKDIWENINLQVSIVVYHKRESVRYDNILFEKIREQSNHIYFNAYYKQVINGQPIAIPIKQGDIISIIYSFIGSTKYWGSYINRPIDINRAETTVSFEGNLPENYFTIITIDLNGNAKKVDGYRIMHSVDKTTVVLPTNSLSTNDIKGCHFRIYWDANRIFDSDSLNSQFVGPIDPIWKLVE